MIFPRPALAALLLVSLLLAPAAAHAAPAVSPATPSVEAGQPITFAGQGFAPDERLSVWYTAPNDVVLGAPFVFTDGEGRATVTFRVPLGAVGGEWAVTLFGRVSQTAAIARFTVQGRPPEAATLQGAVAPTVGAPGSQFRFSAFGYDDEERISYWFTGPDGQIKDAYNQTRRSDKNGRVDFNWTAPRDAMPGTWVVTIQGIKSGTVRGIPLEIRQPVP
jgi:hypothetical protein